MHHFDTKQLVVKVKVEILTFNELWFRFLWNITSFFREASEWVSERDCLFNVTCNDVSVIYVTAHRCAGGLKMKLNLWSGSQRHRHVTGFFNVPVQTPAWATLFIRLFRETAPFSRLLRHAGPPWGPGGWWGLSRECILRIPSVS